MLLQKNRRDSAVFMRAKRALTLTIGAILEDSIFKLKLILRPLFSAQILTDRTDEEVILATDLNYPIHVIETGMADIFPSLTLIFICGLFLVVSILIQQMGERQKEEQTSFKINLEVSHKTRENLNELNA